MQSAFRPGDALLVVDVQRDFCAGGALAVPNGEDIVPVLNQWLQAAESAEIPILLSRDWHPRGHVSFTDSGGPWAEHCVQDTPGAAFHPRLVVPASGRVVTKGVRFDKDQISVFDQTGLEMFPNLSLNALQQEPAAGAGGVKKNGKKLQEKNQSGKKGRKSKGKKKGKKRGKR